MAVPTVLTQASAGAPALTGEAGSGYNWIKWIAAQAGWTVAFDDPTGYRVALRSNATTGAGMYYLFIDDPALHGSNARSMSVKSYSSMTSIDTGVDEYPTTGHRYIHKSVSEDATARDFRAIVTDRHIYLAVSGRSLDSDAWLYYLGDFVSFAPGDNRAAMMVLSATSGFGPADYTGPLSEVFGFDTSPYVAGLLAQNKNQDTVGVGFALFVSKPNLTSGEIGGDEFGPAVDPITESVNTSRVAVYEVGINGLRGLMPGILAPGLMNSTQAAFFAGDIISNVYNGSSIADCLLVQTSHSATSTSDARRGSALFDISTDWDDW